MGARANDHEDLIWLPALRLSFARSLSFYNGSEEGKTKKTKKKRNTPCQADNIQQSQKMRFGMTTRVYEMSRWSRCPELLKKGLVQSLDGLFFPRLPSIFGHGEKQVSVPSEINVIYISTFAPCVDSGFSTGGVEPEMKWSNTIFKGGLLWTILDLINSFWWSTPNGKGFGNS